MIEISEVEVLGWDHAIRGMRNPLESWGRSDSDWKHDPDEHGTKDEFEVGPNDLRLMSKLAISGADHRKFMRMIVVYADILAPLYWWKEFDTYKVGTVANSCSTMHTIHKKEFDISDFSTDHLISYDEACAIWREDHDLDPRIDDDDPAEHQEDAHEVWSFAPIDILNVTIKGLNRYRDLYLWTRDKKYWRQMIQLLPTSYNQRRTVMLNYEVLANIYQARKDHKLEEWREFCSWIEGLPHPELITCARAMAVLETIYDIDLPSSLFLQAKEIDERIRGFQCSKLSDFLLYDETRNVIYAFDLTRIDEDDMLDTIRRNVELMRR